MLEDFQNIKTPKDLYEAIKSDLSDQNKWYYKPYSSLMGSSPQHAAQQAAIRIREENQSCGLPPVPSSANTVNIQNWCIDAQKIMDEVKKSGGTEPAKSKPQEKDGQSKTPDDLIDLAKAVELYHRSRAQLKRDIEDGKIKDHRKIKKGKHWISKSEADNLYILK